MNIHANTQTHKSYLTVIGVQENIIIIADPLLSWVYLKMTYPLRAAWPPFNIGLL